MASQIPFSFPCVEALNEEDFLISSSNQSAMGMIDRWPAWPSHIVILTGAAGVGKTHLSNVWRLRSGAVSYAVHDMTMDLLAKADFSNGIVVEDFDTQLQGGSTGDETALFHLLNMAREQSFHILLTGRTLPGRWDIQLPDLRSRLRAAPLVTIETPDDSLLNGILVKLFNDRQLKVSPTVITYIINRMERSADFARQLVANIDETSLAQRRQVTCQLASIVLNEMLGERHLAQG